MSAAAGDFWARARDALRVAKHDLPVSADAATSWAYYAAFYAVSAHFALEGRSFTRHSAVEAAVHRDLVHRGKWPDAVGKTYSRLLELREKAHYGGETHASPDEAADAIAGAEQILRAIAQAHPDGFTGLEGKSPDAGCEQGNR